MPNWKKVLLSGSKAAVCDITASHLPAEDSSLNDVVVINSSGHFQTASRGDFGGSAKGPLRAVQFAYSEDNGSTFLLSGSEFLLFDEPNKELIISASGEGSINIGRDGGISSDDTLGNLNFIGTGSAVIEGPSATIQAVAVQDFDANTKGAKLEFYTADNQDATLGAPKLTISGSIISSSVNIISPKSIISEGELLTTIVGPGGGATSNVIQIFDNGNVEFGSGYFNKVNFSGTNYRIQAPVTASFHISASGGISASNAHFAGPSHIDNPVDINRPTLTLGRTSGDESIKSLNWFIADSTGNGAALNFWDSSKVLLANGGGNVGIGVFGSSVEPGEKLEVRGNISASGDLYALDIEVRDITASGLNMSLQSITDNAAQILVYQNSGFNTSNITLGKTKYITSSGAGIKREGTGPYTMSLDLDSLATSTTDGDGDFFVVVDDSGTQRKLTKGNIDLAGFNNSNTNFGTGTIGGSAVNGRVAFGDSTANTLTSDSLFLFNNTTNALYVGGPITASNLRIADRIAHSGDSDTHIQFYTDEIQLRAGANSDDAFLVLKDSADNLMRGSLQLESKLRNWQLCLTSSVNNGLAHDGSTQSPMVDFRSDRGGQDNPLGGIRFLNSGDSGGSYLSGSYAAAGIFAFNQTMYTGTISTPGGPATVCQSGSGDNDGMLEFWVNDGGTGKRALALAHDGNPFVPYIRSSTGTNYVRYHTGTGELTYLSSRRETKTNITDIGNKNNYLTTEDFSKIKPKTFSYKNEPNVLTGGFIAEELAEVNPILASWGPNSKITANGEVINDKLIDDKIVPVDVNDRTLLALCVAKIQELEAEIKLLKSKES